LIGPSAFAAALFEVEADEPEAEPDPVADASLPVPVPVTTAPVAVPTEAWKYVEPPLADVMSVWVVFDEVSM
jgi:hypothetical protein